MTVLLDAGALVAIERDDRRVAALIELARRNGGDLRTVAPVVGQVWRDGATQVRLVRALSFVDVVTTDDEAARRAGERLATTRRGDVVDALLADVARPGDQLLTGDVDDLTPLVDPGVAVVRV